MATEPAGRRIRIPLNMRPVTILFLVALITLPPSVNGQERPFPYSLSSSDLLMLPGSLLLSQWGAREADVSREPLTLQEIRELKRGDVNRFDRSATGNWSWEWGDRSDEYRDRVIVATIGIGMYETVRSRDLDEIATMGVMFLEAAFLVRGTTYLAKGLVGRKRPFVYNTALDPEFRYRQALDDGNDVFHSFFSGHTVAAFSLATFTSSVFTDIHGPSTLSHLLWGSTLTLATLTAYARVKAGVHYPSDVIVGAIVGSAIGFLVPALHRHGRPERVALEILPDRVGFRFQIGSR
ncbi:phosphatase PAP2 family protein [Gemmatimonadota bacterium]